MNEKYLNNLNVTSSAQPNDPYQAHQQASAEWNEACHSFRQAEQRREVAAKRLAETTQRLAELLQAAQYDPTQPQPAPSAGNGVAGMTQQVRY